MSGHSISVTSIKQDKHHIEGTHYLRDHLGKVKFEMVYGQSWTQWGNTNDNLCLCTETTERFCNQWIKERELL